jgi:hypothetical protein
VTDQVALVAAGFRCNTGGGDVGPKWPVTINRNGLSRRWSRRSRCRHGYVTAHFGRNAKSVTFGRNGRSRSAEIAGHVAAKWVVTLVRYPLGAQRRASGSAGRKSPSVWVSWAKAPSVGVSWAQSVERRGQLGESAERRGQLGAQRRAAGGCVPSVCIDLCVGPEIDVFAASLRKISSVADRPPQNFV